MKARALAAVLNNNATLTIMGLEGNDIGAEGARAVAAALANNATLTFVNIHNINIGDEGARALAAVLDTNRTLQVLQVPFYLTFNGVTADITNVVADRLRVNKTSSLPRWPRGSPPRWRGASISGTTSSSSRQPSPPALPCSHSATSCWTSSCDPIA
jgi:hypothetical protein